MSEPIEHPFDNQELNLAED